jgi:hypothetical protein
MGTTTNMGYKIPSLMEKIEQYATAKVEYIGQISLLKVKKVLPRRSSEPAPTSILRRKAWSLPGNCFGR